MGMASGIEQLRAMTEEELIRAHDDTNQNRAVSSSYYLDELRRREAQRAEAASYNLATESHNLAKSVFRLTVFNTVFAGFAAIVAIVALFVR